MDFSQKIAKIAGILFIIQMAAAIISFSVILEPVLYKADFINELSVYSTKVTLAVLLDLTCGASVFAIAVLLYPILKQFSKRVALWYVGQRITELVGFMISGFIILTMLKIGQDISDLTAEESSYLELLAIYLRDARANIQIISLLLYCLGAWAFYGLLYYSRLVPRFISVWGFLGVILLFSEIISNIFNTSLGGIMIMIPLGLNEVFLGFWLIIKGFNTSIGESTHRVSMA